VRRQRPGPAGPGQEHLATAAQPREGAVTEAVRSLEVRWIFPGQLEAAVARWFRRFPARTESREDTYLLDPALPGLSVKIRGGGALEVKAYRGSPGILEVAGRARGHMESWQKWSFPFSPLSHDSGDPASWRPVRKGRRISRFPLGSGQIVAPAPGWARNRGARWNSPRSTLLASTGGPWDSRQPDRPACSTANSRPPPRSYSTRPCPMVWNPARMNPDPMRNGCPSGPAPAATPAPKDCLFAQPGALIKTQADAKTFASEAKPAYPSQTMAKFNDWPGTVLVT
jgi:hypothetical protein